MKTEDWNTRPIEDALEAEVKEWRKGFNEVTQLYRIELEKNRDLKKRVRDAVDDIQACLDQLEEVEHPELTHASRAVAFDVSLGILRKYRLIEEDK